MTLLADGARPGDTIADVHRREGLFATPLKASEILGGWMLPHLANAIRREEEAAQAEALGRQVEIIEKRFGKRETDGEEHTVDP